MSRRRGHPAFNRVSRRRRGTRGSAQRSVRTPRGSVPIHGNAGRGLPVPPLGTAAGSGRGRRDLIQAHGFPAAVTKHRVPSAARMDTQLALSPSIATRYRSPWYSATTGNEMTAAAAAAHFEGDQASRRQPGRRERPLGAVEERGHTTWAVASVHPSPHGTCETHRSVTSGQTSFGTLPVRVKTSASPCARNRRLGRTCTGSRRRSRRCPAADRSRPPSGRRSGAGAAVHPHLLDPELGALAHRLLGGLGLVPITTASTPPGIERRS